MHLAGVRGRAKVYPASCLLVPTRAVAGARTLRQAGVRVDGVGFALALAQRHPLAPRAGRQRRLQLRVPLRWFAGVTCSNGTCLRKSS